MGQLQLGHSGLDVCADDSQARASQLGLGVGQFDAGGAPVLEEGAARAWPIRRRRVPDCQDLGRLPSVISILDEPAGPVAD